MMKKLSLKLVIRRETLRALTELELARVTAGGAVDGLDAGTGGPETGCPYMQIALLSPKR